MRNYLFEILLYILMAAGIALGSDGRFPMLALGIPALIVAPVALMKWRRRRRGEEPVEEDEPTLSDHERLRALRTAAATFGMIGLFGLSDFAGTWMRGALDASAFVSGAAALVAAIAGAVLWRDARRVGARPLDETRSGGS